MAFIASCPCGYSKSLTEFYAGSKVRCPRCRSVMFVPVSDTVHEIDNLPDFDASRRMRPVHPGEEVALNTTAQSEPTTTHFAANTRPQAYTPQPVDIPLRPKLPAKRANKQQFNQIFEQRAHRSCGLLGFLTSTAVLSGGVVSLFSVHHPRGIILAAMVFGIAMLYTWVRSISRKSIFAGVSAMILSSLALILSFNNVTDRHSKYSIKFLPLHEQICPFDEHPGCESNSEFTLPRERPSPSLIPGRKPASTPEPTPSKKRAEQDF